MAHVVYGRGFAALGVEGELFLPVAVLEASVAAVGDV